MPSAQQEELYIARILGGDITVDQVEDHYFSHRKWLLAWEACLNVADEATRKVDPYAVASYLEERGELSEVGGLATIASLTLAGAKLAAASRSAKRQDISWDGRSEED